MIRSLRAVFICLLALSFLVTACGQDGNTAQPQTKDGKQPLTIALPTEIKSMDLYAHNDFVTWMAINNMYNTLLKRDEKGFIVNDLAESYTTVNDVTWEFVLKKGVKFHDGTELTAEDVKFSFERAVADKTLGESIYYKSIKEVKVIDPYKVQFITDGPNPLFLSVVARTSAAIYPKKYIQEKGIDYFHQNPIGTGPFKFVEWIKGNQLTLEPYEQYYEGPVKDWNKLVFRIIPEGSTRIGELLTGGVDIIAGVGSNDWKRIQDNDKTELVSGASNRVAFLVPKATPGSPLEDPRVREAIELAIDKNLIIEKLLGGSATPTRTRITPGNFGANEKLFNTALYDVERAKQLLKEAGYANGLELTMQSTTGRYAKDKEVTEMVVGMLANVGIKVKLQLLEYSVYEEIRKANKVGDLHMVWLANSYFDAYIMGTEHLTSTRNMTNLGLKNPELEDVLKKAEKNMNQEERKALYQKAQELEADQFMRTYLYLEHNSYGVNKSVNFTPRIDEMFKAYEIKKR